MYSYFKDCRLTPKESSSFIKPDFIICKSEEKLIIDVHDTEDQILNKCLDHFKLPRQDGILTIDFLDSLMDKSQFIKENLSDEFQTLRLKQNHLDKILNEEEELDHLEVKLAKLNKDYAFISDPNLPELKHVKAERVLLEKILANFNEQYTNSIKEHLNIVSKFKIEELIKSFKNNEHLLYCLQNFGFFRCSDQVSNVLMDYEAKLLVEKLSDSIEKRLCIALAVNDTVSIDRFCVMHSLERSDVINVVIDMCVFGLVEYDDVDFIMLK